VQINFEKYLKQQTTNNFQSGSLRMLSLSRNTYAIHHEVEMHWTKNKQHSYYTLDQLFYAFGKVYKANNTVKMNTH